MPIRSHLPIVQVRFHVWVLQHTASPTFPPSNFNFLKSRTDDSVLILVADDVSVLSISQVINLVLGTGSESPSAGAYCIADHCTQRRHSHCLRHFTGVGVVCLGRYQDQALCLPAQQHDQSDVQLYAHLVIIRWNGVHCGPHAGHAGSYFYCHYHLHDHHVCAAGTCGAV